MMDLRARGASRYFLLAASLCGLTLAVADVFPSNEEPLTDPIASLQKKISSGNSLSFDFKHGYLNAILKELNVSPASQVLVFSKTSFQGTHISPKTPRAIYFNDHAYVGWVNGGDLIEIGSIDPKQGTVFYTIRNSKQPEPKFEVDSENCVACHGRRSERSIPSLMVRSVFPDNDGYPMFTSGGRETTPRTPFNDRWGGWYVTGTHGEMRHMGNIFAVGDDMDKAMDLEKGANIASLKPFFDVSQYLTDQSDIVALMVLEHQLQVQNLLNRVLLSARSGSEDRIAGSARSLANALLHEGEIQLSSPIKGGKEFQTAYLAAAMKDKQGRSLRDFDLKTRVFKYRLSPMIYSDPFNGLPESAKRVVYAQVAEKLKSDSVPADESKAIKEILLDTKPDFAEFLKD